MEKHIKLLNKVLKSVPIYIEGTTFSDVKFNDPNALRMHINGISYRIGFTGLVEEVQGEILVCNDNTIKIANALRKA